MANPCRQLYIKKFTCYAPVHPSGFYDKIQDMRIYQKDINSEQDFYREITRQIQESKGIVQRLSRANKSLLRLLNRLRECENNILDACLRYLNSKKCFGEKKKRVLEAFHIYLSFLWEIEDFFTYLDWRSFLRDRIEKLFIILSATKRTLEIQFVENKI